MVKTIPIGEYPEGIEAGSGEAYVYVVNWFDNVLKKIDTATLDVVGEVEVGDGPRAFGTFIRKVP